jgi:uncharacterized membrane protein YfcA
LPFGLTPPSGSILPIFDYSHAAGRCSITSGYVYRGARSALPAGAYVYADHCTGVAGEAGSITVTTDQRCAWSATPGASWITITSGSFGTGNGSVSFSVASNMTGLPSKGAVTIGNRVFRIKQR